MRKGLKIFFWLWTITMLYLFLNPGTINQGIRFFEGEDKVVHAVLFMCWTGSLYLIWSDKENKNRVFWTIALLVVLFALGTEWAQSYIPKRSADLSDALADCVGGTLGLFIGSLLKKELLRRENKLEK